MLRQLFNRLLLSIPVVLCVLLLGFVMLVFSPADPVAVVAGDAASPEVMAQVRRDLGLDKPIPTQFVLYLGRLLSGDLGKSLLNHLPVSAELMAKLGPTIELTLCSLLIAIPLGIALGTVSAVKRGSPLDGAISLVTIAGISVPVFMTGLVLIQFVAKNGGFLPVQGRAGPLWTGAGLSSILMPALTLAVLLFGPIARLTRTTMIEILESNFIRTARAKGVGELTILWRHGLRNAAIPVVTLIGLLAGYLLGGAVVTEAVFGWPGLGQLSVNAIVSGDYPMAQGGILMLTLTFVVINILTDMVCLVLDPRLGRR